MVTKDIWALEEVPVQEAERGAEQEARQGSTATGGQRSGRAGAQPPHSTDDSDSSTSCGSTYAHRCMLEKHQVRRYRGYRYDRLHHLLTH